MTVGVLREIILQEAFGECVPELSEKKNTMDQGECILAAGQ
jgi:hypothetical protein